MRMSRAFAPTLKEVPADAQVASHIFMIRGGFIRPLAAGIYNLLPLGLRVVHKIANIVRDELGRAGAQEVLMPTVLPAEPWQESGRWDSFGPALLRFKDRKGGDFCLGPTHEEIIVDMVRRDTSSYRDLPLNLYQIQGKFRDEPRPRAGLMRGREFIMKDAYSFDVSEDAARVVYRGMYDAYARIFARCGLSFRAVEADTGAIGGILSHEFQVLAASGEDTLVACRRCDYAANVERAEFEPAPVARPAAPAALTRVDTPNQRTIDEVVAFLKVQPSQAIKTLIYTAGDELVAALVRGDAEVNEVALRRALAVDEVNLAGDEQAVEATGAPVGFAGPVGLKLRVVADEELRGAADMVAGANAKDAHYTGVDLERDVKVDAWTHLRAARAGDRCPRCKEGTFEVQRGIEVGHVFLLGTKYSEPMKCTFLDEEGNTKPMVMGCYGIGITRVAAAAIEQNHDADGIVWPLPIAPFEVALLALQAKDDELMQTCDRLYDELSGRGIEVLYDDRNERPGGKFKDADLIGVPLRIAVGKRGLADGKVELKWRKDKESELVALDAIVERVAALVQTHRKGI